MGRRTTDAHGDRKTRAVRHRHQLRTFARLSFANATTPFLALANAPSMKHSSTSIFPLSYRSWANVLDIFDNVLSSTQRRHRLWQVWYDGNRSGQSLHRAPERNIHTIPSFSMARSVWLGHRNAGDSGHQYGQGGMGAVVSVSSIVHPVVLLDEA